MTQIIRKVNVDGETVRNIIYDCLEPALDGQRKDHSVVALLTFACLLMKPDIEGTQLQDVILNVSELLVTALASTQSEEAN